MPWWDDSGTAWRWPDLMRQIGELAPRFGELYGETGRRALAGCQLVNLRVALRYASDAAPVVAPVVERVIALRERVLRGEEPAANEWHAAQTAAQTAAQAAAQAADASWTGSPSAARAAVVIAEAAVWAASRVEARAAVRAAESASHRGTTGSAARMVASDEIIQGHIDAIREALGTEGERR